MKRATVGLMVCLTMGWMGCVEDGAPQPETEAVDSVQVARSPQAGKADGSDSADRSCRLVLREAGRIGDGRGGFETLEGDWVFQGSVDVSKQVFSSDMAVRILFSSSAITSPEFGKLWWSVKATEVEGAAEGFRRFAFTIEDTGFGPGMSGTALSRATLSFIPYLNAGGDATGGFGGVRIFDHNRLPGEFDIYTMDVNNGWSVARDDAVCNANPEPPKGPSWIGNPTAKFSRGSLSTCGGRDVRSAEDGFFYEEWARQRAAIRSFCFEVWEPGVTDRDNPDLWKQLNVQIHYRWHGSVNWNTKYVDLADRVDNNARYGFDLGQLDPFGFSRCPDGGVTLENGEAIAAMDYFVTVNGVEFKNAQGEPFVGRFATHAANWEQRCR